MRRAPEGRAFARAEVVPARAVPPELPLWLTHTYADAPFNPQSHCPSPIIGR